MDLVIFDILLLILYWIIYKEIFGPGFYLVIMWLLSHAFMLTNIVDWGKLINFRIYYYSFMLIFLIWNIIMCKIAKKNFVCSEKKTQTFYVKKSKELNRIFFVLLLLCALGIVLSYFITGISLQAIIQNPAMTLMANRYGANVAVIPRWLHILRFLLPVCSVYLGFFFDDIRFNLLAFVSVLGLGLLFDAIQFSRNGIMIVLLFFSVSYINGKKAHNKKIDIRLLIGMFCLFLIIFFITANIRVNKSMSYGNSISGVIKSIYVYFTCGNAGFNNVLSVDKKREFMYGVACFDGIFNKLSSRVDYSIPAPGMRYNFFTGFREIYLDFHEYGFIFFPLIASTIYNCVYFRAKWGGKLYSYVYLTYCQVFFMFFFVISLTTTTYYWYSLFVLLFIFHYMIRYEIIETNEKHRVIITFGGRNIF